MILLEAFSLSVSWSCVCLVYVLYVSVLPCRPWGWGSIVCRPLLYSGRYSNGSPYTQNQATTTAHSTQHTRSTRVIVQPTPPTSQRGLGSG